MEEQLPSLVRRALDSGLRHLQPEVEQRLDAARDLALSRQRHPAAHLALAGNVELATGLWAFRPRALGVLALATAFLLGTAFIHGQRHIHDIEEVDSAILTDALPLEAYQNKDFDKWLRRDAQF